MLNPAYTTLYQASRSPQPLGALGCLQLALANAGCGHRITGRFARLERGDLAVLAAWPCRARDLPALAFLGRPRRMLAGSSALSAQRTPHRDPPGAEPHAADDAEAADEDTRHGASLERTRHQLRRLVGRM
eukprot:4915571-Prymnesium_polylepis.1